MEHVKKQSPVPYRPSSLHKDYVILDSKEYANIKNQLRDAIDSSGVYAIPSREGGDRHLP